MFFSDYPRHARLAYFFFLSKTWLKNHIWFKRCEISASFSKIQSNLLSICSVIFQHIYNILNRNMGNYYDKLIICTIITALENRTPFTGEATLVCISKSQTTAVDLKLIGCWWWLKFCVCAHYHRITYMTYEI